LPRMLNDFLGGPFGESFPPTRLAFSDPDRHGWSRFDKTLIRYGHVRRGMLGIQMRAVTPKMAASAGLSEPEGVEVENLTTENGPAAKAGIRAHDIILAVRGVPIKTLGEFVETVGRTAPGSQADILLLRNHQQQHVTVTVGELPQGAKPRYRFVAWENHALSEPGRIDETADHEFLFGMCLAEDKACNAAVEAMRNSWSAGVRQVPTPWGGLLTTWSWLLLAAGACFIIGWRRRRTDAHVAIVVAFIGVVLFSASLTGLTAPDVVHTVYDVDIVNGERLLAVAILAAAACSVGIIGWVTIRRRGEEYAARALRLVIGLNLSLLILGGIFQSLQLSSESAESSSVSKGLLVIAALSWEIAASGSITNRMTRYLPRGSRLLLFLAYALLVAVSTFMFFPSRYRQIHVHAFNPDEYILVGMVLLGIPIMFAAFVIRSAALLGTRKIDGGDGRVVSGR
jgi:hypothetical protein